MAKLPKHVTKLYDWTDGCGCTGWSFLSRNTVCWNQIKSSATVMYKLLIIKRNSYFNVNKRMSLTRWTTLYALGIIFWFCSRSLAVAEAAGEGAECAVRLHDGKALRGARRIRIDLERGRRRRRNRQSGKKCVALLWYHTVQGDQSCWLLASSVSVDIKTKVPSQ